MEQTSVGVGNECVGGERVYQCERKVGISEIESSRDRSWRENSSKSWRKEKREKRKEKKEGGRILQTKIVF